MEIVSRENETLVSIQHAIDDKQAEIAILTEDKLLEQLHSQAFDEMEADMLRFVRGKQNVVGN